MQFKKIIVMKYLVITAVALMLGTATYAQSENTNNPHGTGTNPTEKRKEVPSTQPNTQPTQGEPSRRSNSEHPSSQPSTSPANPVPNPNPTGPTNPGQPATPGTPGTPGTEE